MQPTNEAGLRCKSCDAERASQVVKIATASLTDGSKRDWPVCEEHLQMAMVAGWFPIRDVEAGLRVTQGDREAAADWMSEQNYDWGFCGDVRAGRVEHDLPLAFARHRLSAFSAGERAGIERAAEVAVSGSASKPKRHHRHRH
jgi:hypothetical protein